ncbi:MAG: hypothetical protein WEB53_04465 [Akkermansiaceae bacterium]
MFGLVGQGEEAAGATTGDYQRETSEKDREYDSTASALEGKRELNAEETDRLKRLWKKLACSGTLLRRNAASRPMLSV